MGISLIALLMITGSLSLGDIVHQQLDHTCMRSGNRWIPYFPGLRFRRM